MSKSRDLAAIVSAFGAATKRRFANAGATGAPEDQLRTPLDKLVKDIAELSGLPANAIELVGESTLSHLSTRPDFAVTLKQALIGFIEVKAPGKGADPRKFSDDHDKKQWTKLKTLPNLVYTDGNSFSLWHDGRAGRASRPSRRRCGNIGRRARRPTGAARALFGLPRLAADCAAQRQSSWRRSARGCAGCCARR